MDLSLIPKTIQVSTTLSDRGVTRSRRRWTSYGLPRERVRVGEGSGVVANHDPMRSAAVGGDIGVLGERAAPIQPQFDGTGRGFELCVVAAKALGRGEAAVDVEALA